MFWFFYVLSNYFDFSGRARRREYWFFILFYYLLLYAGFFLDEYLNLYFNGTELGFLSLSILLLLMIPSFSVSIRRLHGVGKSGFFLFINLIPLIGPIWLLVLNLTEGDRKRNRYGDDPKLTFN